MGKLNVLPPNPQGTGCGHQGAVVGLGRFPEWLHRKLPKGNALWSTGKILSENRLHTVCEEARCPNILQCWSKKTATFLIMGKQCTRSCGFCDIDFSKNPGALQADEPERVADSVKKLGLKHVVITMVARDDLEDGGASQMVRTVEVIRREVPSVTIELLTSDFKGNEEALETVLRSNPEVFNHNIETVRELSPKVRHTANYETTLKVLRQARNYAVHHAPKMFIKSGIMVGLGETIEQVQETLRDLKEAGCDIVTMGQYLQPNRHKLRVKAFITPEQFKAYEDYGYQIGIKKMYCGPFVRSSFNADLIVRQVNPITQEVY